MNIEQQYNTYINQITNRKRNPAKGATLAAYHSYWRTWIQPEIGALEVSQVENGIMKRLVARIAAAGLSSSTIAGVTNCVKGIVSSAVDENGNELFLRKWNADFIDAPVIDPKNQKAPILSREALQESISRTQGQFRTLCILLAGSGLRINEALALKVGSPLESSCWIPKESKLVIRRALWRGIEQSTKTSAGVREVDLASKLNEFLLQNISQNNTFCFGNGQPLCLSTVYDAAEKTGIPGFHAFRRFRCTHLENAGVPRGLALFWTGHSGKDVHDRYIKLDKDIEARKEWVERAGLGFELPKFAE